MPTMPRNRIRAILQGGGDGEAEPSHRCWNVASRGRKEAGHIRLHVEPSGAGAEGLAENNQAMNLNDIKDPKLRERILQADATQNSGRRRNPVVQEQQNDCPHQGSSRADNQPKKAAGDGGDNPQYRITVTLLVSDWRDRDGDGAYSTLQDCLIHAAGRLLEMDSRTLRSAAKGVERSGGCGD